VEEGVTIGDYLSGFLQGTRRALHDNGRESITITIREVNAFSVGCLIALFERAVGFYGSLVGFNAYHQPGVEAGKKAAAKVLDLQTRAVEALRNQPGSALTAKKSRLTSARATKSKPFITRCITWRPMVASTAARALPAGATFSV
jgi:glucose-6-phosphate isomerase